MNQQKGYTSVDTAETTKDNHDINEIILTEYLNILNPSNFMNFD